MMVEEDDIPKVNDLDFIDVSIFRQLYLIGKMLGEAVQVKLVISKCSMDLSGRGSKFCSYGQWIRLVKFTN